MATHNPDVVKSLGKRVIQLENGAIVKDHGKVNKEKDKEKEKDSEKGEKEEKKE
jgi:ABC-type methionine transport system ATPase subunit